MASVPTKKPVALLPIGGNASQFEAHSRRLVAALELNRVFQIRLICGPMGKPCGIEQAMTPIEKGGIGRAADSHTTSCGRLEAMTRISG